MGLCEIEIVFHQRILGVMPAANHARATVQTAAARRTFAIKIWIGHLTSLVSLITEKDPDRRGAKGCAPAELSSNLLQHGVGRTQARIARHPQHTARSRIMRT